MQCQKKVKPINKNKMKLATISNKGIELNESVDFLNLVNTPDEIINLNKFYTGRVIDNVEEILDMFECIPQHIEKMLAVVYMVRGIDIYKSIITFEPESTKLLVYVEDEEGNFGKMMMRGTYQVFDNKVEATKYADYQYAILRRDELERQISELNEEMSKVKIDVENGVKIFG